MDTPRQQMFIFFLPPTELHVHCGICDITVCKKVLTKKRKPFNILKNQAFVQLLETTSFLVGDLSQVALVTLRNVFRNKLDNIVSLLHYIDTQPSFYSVAY